VTEKTEAPDKSPEQIEAEHRLVEIQREIRRLDVLGWGFIGLMGVAVVAQLPSLIVGSSFGAVACVVCGYWYQAKKRKVTT
jgi:hypothetical protein